MNTKYLAFAVLFVFANGPRGAAAREAAFAGKFYPAGKKELAGYIDRVLAAREARRLRGAPLAVIVPHAGYPFSGGIAADAYRNIGEAYDLVVVLGAGHTMGVKGAALLAKGHYETPLGWVQVDEALSAELMKTSPLFEDSPAAHLNEHSIEVQLPFLQRRLKKPFKLVAAVLNNAGPDDLLAIGRILGGKLKGRKALLIVSTDLSHYPKHGDAALVDNTLIAAINTLDPGLFLFTSRILLSKGISGLSTCACGEAAIAAAMAAVNELGPARFVELKYGDSYSEAPNLTGPEKVVGYLAGVFVKAEKAVSGKIDLSPEQKKTLLAEARAEMGNRLLDKKPSRERLSKDHLFNLPAAVFVTLTEAGVLRGCVGTVEPRLTLLDAVRYGAKAAAFEDGRFKPLEKGELGKVKIEISILSPLKKIGSAAPVVPHKHGVVLSGEGRSGLFLPQVWEQIPGKEDFLSELCSQKAGLPRDCWKDGKTDIYTFTVDSFEEN